MAGVAGASAVVEGGAAHFAAGNAKVRYFAMQDRKSGDCSFLAPLDRSWRLNLWSGCRTNSKYPDEAAGVENGTTAESHTA